MELFPNYSWKRHEFRVRKRRSTNRRFFWRPGSIINEWYSPRELRRESCKKWRVESLPRRLPPQKATLHRQVPLYVIVHRPLTRYYIHPYWKVQTTKKHRSKQQSLRRIQNDGTQYQKHADLAQNYMSKVLDKKLMKVFPWQFLKNKFVAGIL